MGSKELYSSTRPSWRTRQTETSSGKSCTAQRPHLGEQAESSGGEDSSGGKESPVFMGNGGHLLAKAQTSGFEQSHLWPHTESSGGEQAESSSGSTENHLVGI